MRVKILKENHIKKVFNMKDAIKTSKDALKLYSKGASDIPPRVSIEVPNENAQSLYMPGFVEKEDALGLKIVSSYPKNIGKGLDTISSMMIMKNVKTGEISSIIDGAYLTKLRTGALAGAATDLLAREDASIFALIGSGGQARTQLEAILNVRDIKEVRISGRDKEKAKRFVGQMRDEFGGRFGCKILLAKDADEAVKGADIITLATSALSPVFDGKLVGEGCHINAIGSFRPDMQELDPYILKISNKIYLDTKDGVLSESGDFIIPIKEGEFLKEDISGELGEIILGKAPSRENDSEISLFKSVGIGVLDLLTAKRIYDKAVEMEVGDEINF